MSLDELIARLEAASEGSRELDAAIRFAVAGDMTRCNFDEGCYHGDCVPPGCGGWLGIHDERKSYPCDWRDDERLPRYTTSLDAAMGLVPEGWGVGLDIIGGGAVACLTLPGNSFLGDRGDTDLYGRSKSAPLALCIAALRARVQP